MVQQQKEEIVDKVIELTNRGAIKWEKKFLTGHNFVISYMTKFKHSHFELTHSLGILTLVVDYCVFINDNQHLEELEIVVQGSFVNSGTRFNEADYMKQVLLNLNS